MFMRILQEAGLPDGVINLIYVDGPNWVKFVLTTVILRESILQDQRRVFNTDVENHR